MKLHTLQALVAAVEEGSLRGAAKRLNVSQPALTKAIRDLELELGANLLVRTSQGVVPSAQGMVLHEHALRVTRELTSASDKIKQLSGRMTGQLSVGAVPLAVMLLLPHLGVDPQPAGVLLALVSTFAGNLLLVGSIANLIVADLAAKEGIVLDWKRHLLTGLPVTFSSLLVVWVVFSR